MNNRKINIKKVLITMLWIIIAAGTVVLSVAAMKRQNEQSCKGIEVNISGVNNNFFIDKKDVLDIIDKANGGKAKGVAIADFNLRKLEAQLEKDVWVDNAELFFDNNGILQVSIEEREPVARIFTTSNNTFYIDSAATMLPLSDKFSARLPVFTGFMSDAKVLSKADSNLLFGIRKISMALQADSFLMAMIDQVDITADRGFEMTPKIGKQIIMFGDASDADAKFAKLKLFYKEVMLKSGWSRYSSIDLQYAGQVVAKIRGKEDVAADSIRTLQLMDFMAKNAAALAADSLRKYVPDIDNGVSDIKSIQQSEERDEGPEMTEDNYPVVPAAKAPEPVVVKPVVSLVAKPTATATKPVAKPVLRPAEAKPVVKKPVVKPTVVKKTNAEKKPAVTKPVQKPKAVMQKKNDY